MRATVHYKPAGHHHLVPMDVQPGHPIPDRLQLVLPSLELTGETTLGECVNGTELRSDQTGRVLLASTYQFCNPPGTHGPNTLAFTDNGHGPVIFYDQPNGGETAFSALSW